MQSDNLWNIYFDVNLGPGFIGRLSTTIVKTIEKIISTLVTPIRGNISGNQKDYLANQPFFYMWIL